MGGETGNAGKHGSLVSVTNSIDRLRYLKDLKSTFVTSIFMYM